MNKDIWAIWRNPDFLIPTIAFVIAMLVALFFEYKYFIERRKNEAYRKNSQCVAKYVANPTIAPLKPISVIQNAADGTFQLGSTPIGIITKASVAILRMKTIVIFTILSIFIKCIISKVKRWCNQMQIKPQKTFVDN